MTKEGHDKSKKKDSPKGRGEKARSRGGVDRWVAERKERTTRDGKSANTGDRAHVGQPKKAERSDKLSLAHRLKHRDAKDGPRGLEKLKQTLAESGGRSDLAAESKLGRLKAIVEQIDGARSDKSAKTAATNNRNSETPKRVDKANDLSLQAAIREGRTRGDKQNDQRELRIHGPGHEGYPRNGDTLLLNQLKRLERAVTPLDGTPLYGNDKLTLFITATASRLGGEQANQALSERRVDNVANWFRERGFTGKIERDPVGENSSKDKNPQSDNPEDRVVHVSLDQGRKTGRADLREPSLKDIAEKLAGGVPEAPPKQSIKEQAIEFAKDLKTVDDKFKKVAPDAETRVLVDLVGAMGLVFKDHAANFLRERNEKTALGSEYLPAFVSGILESAHASPYSLRPLRPDGQWAKLGRSHAERVWGELPAESKSQLSKIILRDQKAFGRELDKQTRKRLGLPWADR